MNVDLPCTFNSHCVNACLTLLADDRRVGQDDVNSISGMYKSHKLHGRDFCTQVVSYSMGLVLKWFRTQANCYTSVNMICMHE